MKASKEAVERLTRVLSESVAQAIVECMSEDYPEEDEESEELDADDAYGEEEDDEMEESTTPASAKAIETQAKWLMAHKADASEVFADLPSFEEQMGVAEYIGKKDPAFALDLMASIEVDEPEYKALYLKLKAKVPKPGSESHGLKEAIEYDVSEFVKKKDVPMVQALLKGAIENLSKSADAADAAVKALTNVQDSTQLDDGLESKLIQFTTEILDLKKAAIKSMSNFNKVLKSIGKGIGESVNEAKGAGGTGKPAADDGSRLKALADAISGSKLGSGFLTVTAGTKDEVRKLISKGYSVIAKAGMKTTFRWDHKEGKDSYTVDLYPL